MTSTFTGNHGLQIEEPLIFELDTPGLSGTDWPEASTETSYLNGLERVQIGLPGLSEPMVVRHYTRLSQKNYSIDTGLYPLGSCTMKHNPRLNEKVARFFGDLHPLQPVTTLQGALAVIHSLAEWLTRLTGMAGVALSPAAGAHGELCGIMAIRKALEARNEHRPIILVPESAHGTNPATAAACGFQVRTIPAAEDGRVDLPALLSQINDEVAGIMLTNPNTCGLFERDIIDIAEAIHKAGAYFYCDGANFNAIVGKTRPADLGIDCMHINLHKTFSTPHGGGGPGSGPVVLSERLIQYAPLPYVIRTEKGFDLIESYDQAPASLGRIKGFHGQMGMLTRALAFMMSHGRDGLKQVAEDAVLNANYILARLKDHLSPAFVGSCMHEALFDDTFLDETKVSTLDFAKAMIDQGYHPMTMYFPLVVSGALLMEPTESESKRSLDEFCDTLIHLAQQAKSGNTELFIQAPQLAPRRRLDETRAARHPKLRWVKEVKV
ncbi:aminomethyl-transferring glycine dehydrogenase subunit GcvPB [Candidatus Odyssella thessalonicensis]|uniref:aminomethyl-transferring glycine dehydrogenase subunit GcvPB n=1 Tax=Candidatus Odyssella thessalonicensis TaxID=84647 RepID=UPI000225BAF5|nr:aminomethyl-transferring glycine dehydrogenase subunit GcvPB [Candidatus Odyssella thessalonicensis]